MSLVTEIVVYDACVLYPAPLRSLFMYLALGGMFRAKWTAAIHEEWIRNAIRDYPGFTRTMANRVRDLMDAHVHDALVAGYEWRIPTLTLPDPNDRHVLAAALQCRAATIVTFNLRHFPDSALQRHGVTARHPDEFVTKYLDSHEDSVCAAVRLQRASLKNPPLSVDRFLGVLERQQLIETVSRLRQLQVKL